MTPVPAACRRARGILGLTLNSSKHPNAASMALATSPVGLPPPLGFIDSQKNVWFHTCGGRRDWTSRPLPDESDRTMVAASPGAATSLA